MRVCGGIGQKRDIVKCIESVTQKMFLHSKLLIKHTYPNFRIEKISN